MKSYQNTNDQFQIGQQFTLNTKPEFDRMGVNGEAVGYVDRTLVFIQGALPKERVTIEITNTYHHYLRAKVVNIVTKSPYRVTPRDNYAESVGGFELEAMDYPAQLRYKKEIVRQSLYKYQPIGFERYKIHNTMGMQDPYGYRNKAQFQIRERDGQVIAGLYKTRSHDLVDLKTCSVQYPVTMKVMRAIVAMIQELNIPVYDESNHSGIIKTVVVRAALHTDDVQVVFVTNTKKFVKQHRILMKIALQLPEVTSVMQNINPGDTPLIWGDETILLAGKPFIVEKIGGLEFELSARAFLQLNSFMTPQLYEVAINALDLDGNERLVDAYSGVGTIGLPLAKYVQEVRGMDTIAEAVEDANQNAEINGIRNAQYFVGKAEELIPEWIDSGWRPDALIVDPPRTGLAEPLIDAILDVAPEKFVYVSCNPATLARDLVDLTRRYRVDFIQPIDMMPQTARVEAVVKFTRK
ncbi:23S rRNA (uracil(1939)-C(5))-methyltransferase RlmD [Nicoliella spurrieriana]|uniref:23S rRNA (Uracil(1939)-C(5))-methyltransferase RlmD n=1 Tax=Nicoliella spurrieriana TaxID=2925830 RepID=A0A976RST1_9LACO|nr:23S rRNA (uracil(1939)-C(5))-methyltransferase RlmD [Nicoliella spurrieriana]UQS87115.1 23S rRNA (uracil(1939)-C(5))-methyltransferase RlmD [Nicoliella spurrieriana]